MVKLLMGGKRRNRGCCEAMVAQRIAPGTDGCRGLAAPAAPAPGRRRVVNSDTWSLSYRFTHSLLTNARFAQVPSLGAFPIAESGCFL